MTALPGRWSVGASPRRAAAPALRRVFGALLALVAVAVLPGCGGGATTSTSGPQPAGRTPSPIAKMVCQAKAHKEIDEAVGETATVSTPTWAGHLYSCDYRYPNGTILLSLKELSSEAQTTAYFDQQKVHGYDLVEGLGQGAFAERDGSVVVRKDWKVLIVDIAGLPAQFGVPSSSSIEAALSVADVIVGCWDGD